MKSLSRLGLLLGTLFFFQAFGAPAKAIPALPFRLELSQPRRPRASLEIERKKGLFELRISSGSTPEARGSFDREVVEELFAILGAGGDPFSGWQGDSSCFFRKSFLASSGGRAIRLCSNEARVAKLDDFLAAAQLILRKESGPKK